VTDERVTAEPQAAEPQAAEPQAAERLEVQRLIEAEPAAIFRVLCDPQGHVAIDSTGMLMDATGEPVAAVGDSFVVHMDREALNDFPLGRYDVTVTILTLVPDTEIAWGITGRIRPQVGHTYGYRLEPADGGTLVTSYYDWSTIHPQWREAGIFPVVSEAADDNGRGLQCLDRPLGPGGASWTCSTSPARSPSSPAGPAGSA
jgi:hypothetical protein